jgi:hypothetical protein
MTFQKWKHIQVSEDFEVMNELMSEDNSTNNDDCKTEHKA